MLALALGNIDLEKGKHTCVIAKNLVASVKKIDIKFRMLCQAISKSEHLTGCAPIPFKSKALEPMLAALAPLMDQDTSTLDFNDQQFLTSLNCREAFFETARLLLVENTMLEPDGQLDWSNFHWAVMFSSSLAQELLLAYCPAYMDVFSDWKELSQLVPLDTIPRNFAVAMQIFCTLMDLESVRVFGIEFTHECPLLFFQFPFCLSLGNTKGTTRLAIKLMEIKKGWDLVFEVMPIIKVVHPLFLLSCFFLDQGDLSRGLEAYQIISSFPSKPQTAERAMKLIEAKLALLYPGVLASTNLNQTLRKRAFLEEIDSTTSSETEQLEDSSPEAFLASLAPSTVEAEEREDAHLTATWSFESNEPASPEPLDDVFWSFLKRDTKEDKREGPFELDFTSKE